MLLPLALIAVTFDALILHEMADVSNKTFYTWSCAEAGFVPGAFAGIVTGFMMMLLSRKSVPTTTGVNRNDDLLGKQRVEYDQMSQA